MSTDKKTAVPALVDEPNGAGIRNAKTTKGGAISALVPDTLDDVFRVSKALSISGEMIPSNFRDNPEAIAAAIMRGMEVGFPPMQSLESIAVINGKACLYGDALPALMQKAGNFLDHEISGEGDAMTATATLIRGDTGQKVIRTFSVADAKAAGLFGKSGPWKQYLKRMLAMRARSWACRDGAADAMKGMNVVEEVHDYSPLRNVTPPPSGGWAQQAQAARDKAIEAKPTQEPDDDELDDNQGQTIDGTTGTDEPMPDHEAEELHWTDEFDASEGAPGSEEWDAGVEAFKQGAPRSDCPHEDSVEAAQDWLGGYDGAARAAS